MLNSAKWLLIFVALPATLLAIALFMGKAGGVSTSSTIQQVVGVNPITGGQVPIGGTATSVTDTADTAIVAAAAAVIICPANANRVSVLVQNKTTDPTGTTNIARVGSSSVSNTRGCIAAPNYGGCTFTSSAAIYAFSQNGATLGCTEDTN